MEEIISENVLIKIYGKYERESIQIDKFKSYVRQELDCKFCEVELNYFEIKNPIVHIRTELDSKINKNQFHELYTEFEEKTKSILQEKQIELALVCDIKFNEKESITLFSKNTFQHNSLSFQLDCVAIRVNGMEIDMDLHVPQDFYFDASDGLRCMKNIIPDGNFTYRYDNPDEIKIRIDIKSNNFFNSFLEDNIRSFFSLFFAGEIEIRFV
jgi:hypothetical protein